MKKEEAARLLDLVMRMGIMMILSGAETYRVEQTITYVLRAYGAFETSAYVADTLLVVSFKPEREAEIMTASWRVKNKGINLEKVRRLNNLSYDISRKTLSLDEFRRRLDEIDAIKSYPLLIYVLSGSLIAFGFSLMFYLPLADGIIIALLAAPVMFLYRCLSKVINDFFNYTVCSALATILVLLFLQENVLHQFAYSLASVLMPLMPGALFTNGLRDVTMGDFTAGSNKLLETVLIGVALAVGAAVVLLLFNMQTYYIGTR